MASWPLVGVWFAQTSHLAGSQRYEETLTGGGSLGKSLITKNHLFSQQFRQCFFGTWRFEPLHDKALIILAAGFRSPYSEAHKSRYIESAKTARNSKDASAATGGPFMTKACEKSIRQQSPTKAAIGAVGSDHRWRVAGLCLVLAAITLAVFGQTVGFGFVNLDNDVYVYENANVAGGLSMKGLAWVFTHADCSLYHP